MLTETWPPVKWNYARDAFTVVIGDSAEEDITHFWNHPVTLAGRSRKGINEIWLPTVLAKDDQIKPLGIDVRWLCVDSDEGGLTSG